MTSSEEELILDQIRQDFGESARLIDTPIDAATLDFNPALPGRKPFDAFSRLITAFVVHIHTHVRPPQDITSARPNRTRREPNRK